jgi:formylmethanofuran dehydrogenase subunit E
LLSLTILILVCGSNIFAEGQTNFNKKFFDQVAPIKIKEPFAVALGAIDKDEVFVYRYEDAVKMAGHSCLAVSGAYRMTQIALKHLYGDETPLRGGINVTFKGGVEYKVNGPISQVVTLITGAAAKNGFHGFGGGKYKRHNLMKFDEGNLPPKTAICTVLFKRVDNAKAVEVTYSKNMLPGNPKISDLMPLAISGKGTDEQINEFGNLWHERIKMVLMDDIDGMFVVNEVK